MTLSAIVLLPAAVIALLPHMSRSHGLRAALMRAVLVAALALVVMTELLSALDGLRPVVVASLWLLLIVGSAFMAAIDRGEGSAWALTWRFSRQRLSRNGTLITSTSLTVLVNVAVLGILGLILIIALVSPPNNWDSMTYHLPRVMHWAVNHNVQFYPTTIDRQLYSAPLAEYLILHIYLLTGSDLFFNAVQASALAGCTVVVSLIARQLGGDRRSQGLAAFVAVTIPMAILEASSTQNDLVEAFFLVLVAYTALEFRSSTGRLLSTSWPLAASLALALLTKSTGYLIAAPFVLLGLAGHWRTPRMLAIPLGLILSVVVAVNIGQAVRNENAYASLTGPVDSRAVVNAHFSPAVTAVSSLRLLGSAAATPPASLNTHLVEVVNHASGLAGLRTADQGTRYYGIPFTVGWSTEEDLASYPVHTLAICFLLLVTLLRVPPLRGLRAAYVGAGVAAFLIFASYLRWQPWINRLDMPIAMLWTPVIAVAITSWHRFVFLPAVLIFGCLAPIFVFHNTTRPLVGHANVFNRSAETVLFANRGNVSAPYDAATKIIQHRHAKRVGLIEGVDDWEYPLWRLNGGALHGVQFIDIRAADLKGKQPPRYDMAICTDPVVASCTALTQPGWTVSPIGSGMVVATPLS